MSALPIDREEGGAVPSEASGETALLVPPSSDPSDDVPIEIVRSAPLDPQANLDGRTIFVDGNVTMQDAAIALGRAGFMLINDGTGRLVARRVPDFLRAEA